jgi:hypothetical protein
VTEAVLHKLAGTQIERLAGGRDDFIYNRRRGPVAGVVFVDPLRLHSPAPILFALGTRCAAGAWRHRRPHHLIGDMICFLLVSVLRRIDCQFSLDKPLDRLIADGALQVWDQI